MNSESIHPSGNRKNVANTAKPYRKGGKGKLGRKQKHLSARRNAHSATVNGTKNPAAYRAPGSMKGR